MAKGQTDISQELVIEEPYTERYQYRLTGISPLIMHFDDVSWADQIEAAREAIKENDKKNFKAGDDRCPPDTWKGYLYQDGEHVAMPTDNLRSSVMHAAKKVTLKNRQSFKQLSQSAILFDDMFAEMTFSGGRPIKIADAVAIAGTFSEQAAAVKSLGFTLLVKRAKIGQNKHIRVRPMFKTWTASGTITVVDPQMTPNVLARIWAISSVHVGYCDWRPGSPNSPGPYGKATAELERI